MPYKQPPKETQFKPGISGNEKGRPKGKTLKEFARDLLMTMNDEEKTEYLKTLPKDIVWKMAEGNPHNTEDITSEGKPLQTLLVKILHGERNGNSGGVSETP